VFLHFGKNALSVLAFLAGFQSSCGSDRSCAFFGGAASVASLFYFGRKAYEWEKETNSMEHRNHCICFGATGILRRSYVRQFSKQTIYGEMQVMWKNISSW
jgi:hypothetical protein